MNGKSLRRHEGYLLMDHRAGGIGISDELVAKAAGPAAEMPVGAGRGLFEAPTITCSHCQVVVVINPLRTRERAYCPKCDHYLCDRCGIIRALNGGDCFSFKELADKLQEQGERQIQAEARGLILPGSEELERRVNEIAPSSDPLPTPPAEQQEQPRIIIST